jgi:hypothetical protein
LASTLSIKISTNRGVLMKYSSSTYRVAASLASVAAVVVALMVSPLANAQTCPIADGNSSLEVEGLILTRYALGVTGAPLVANTGINAVDAPTVEATINCPSCGLNITGNPTFTVADATIISRKLAGFNGAALTDGLNLGTGTRNTPAAVQSFLLSGCGATGGTVTSITASTGLAPATITTSGSLSIATTYRLPQSCANGQVAKYNTGTALWECQNDNGGGSGTVTSITAGTGLQPATITTSGSLNLATTYRLPQSCANGQVAKYNTGTSLWECQNDNGGAANAFVQGGNAFGAPGVLGTTDGQPLTVGIGGGNGLRISGAAGLDRPAVLNGSTSNTGSSFAGATVSGGGNSVSGCRSSANPYSYTTKCWNDVLDVYGTVGGGQANTARSQFATVAGGEANTAGTSAVAGVNATVGGGAANRATADSSVIAGGERNFAAGTVSAISGGSANTVYGYGAVIAGGNGNVVGALPADGVGSYATVGGGRSNAATGDSSVVGGGGTSGTTCFDPVTSTNTRVCGNVAAGQYATVGGGISNSADTIQSVVAGGGTNVANGAIYGSTVSGGQSNVASGSASVIGGGVSNATVVGAGYGTIAGGNLNNVSGLAGAIGGGVHNSVTNDYSTISGGKSNVASNVYTTVAGGAAALAKSYGQSAHAAGSFDANAGTAQASEYVFRVLTSDATPTTMGLDGGSVGLTFEQGRAGLIDIQVVGLQDGLAGYVGTWTFRCMFQRSAGGTSFVLPAGCNKTLVHKDLPAWDVNVGLITAFLNIAVTGAASSNIRWVATVRSTEVKW